MKYIILYALILALSGCNTNPTNINTQTKQVEEQKMEYKKINSEQAKKMLDNDKNIILLDVRTQEEFNEKRIEGSILIPDYEITTKAEQILKDKKATILVYCRSGRRSAGAAYQLASMGYSNVYDFGGIIDWKYDTISQ